MLIEQDGVAIRIDELEAGRPSRAFIDLDGKLQTMVFQLLLQLANIRE